MRYLLLFFLTFSLGSIAQAQLFPRLAKRLQVTTVQGNCANGRCAIPTKSTEEWAEEVTTRETAPRTPFKSRSVTVARYTTEELRRLIREAPEVPYVGVRGQTVYQHLVDPKHGFTREQVNGLSSSEAYRLHSLAPTHANVIYPTYRVREPEQKEVKEVPVIKEERKHRDVSIWMENTVSQKSIW